MLNLEILLVLLCFELMISRSFFTAVVNEDACSTVVAVAVSLTSLGFSLAMASTCVCVAMMPTLSRVMSPTQLQDKRILVVTSISLERQEEPQELEVCLEELIKVRRQRRSHRRGLG